MNYDDLLRELKMEAVLFPDISAEDLADIIHALENHFCNVTKEAVKVVRCKNCKYYGQQDSACPFLDEDGYYKELPWEDDFCSRGERKEDA